MPRSCVMLPEGRRPLYHLFHLYHGKQERTTAFRNLPYWHIQTGNSHTFHFEKHVFQFFANDYIIFSFLNSFKVCKIQKKTTF